MKPTVAKAPAGPRAQSGKATLRVLGTSVSLIEPIRVRAEQDLGIHLDFLIEDATNAQRIAALYPEAFDIYDQWFHNLDLIWPTRSIQALDLERIEHWDQINDLPKRGRISQAAPAAPGGNPAHRLFVQHDGELGVHPSGQISMLPTVHNADSFATHWIKADDQGLDKIDSWAALVDPALAGRVAVQSDAAIGVIDLVLAVQAAGWFDFADPGNLTLKEIESFIERLLALRKKGHFKAFWATEAEAGALVEADKVSITSMWWQGFVGLRQRGVPIRMAVPKEGFRGWYGGLALSRRLEGRRRDVAYEYLNWWLSGYAGAVMSRNNAHISNPTASRPYLSEAEWGYWYEGKPAAEDLRCPYGRKIVAKGETYPGGSYDDRMNRIVIWNSVMDEHNYLVRKWTEVLKS